MTARCALYMGALKIFHSSWVRPRLLFPKFVVDFVPIDPMNVRTKFEVVALPVPEIIAIEVLGGGCKPQSWGRGSLRASGMVPFERALVSSYRPSMVTIFTRFRDVAAFVLQHATFSHPTSSLPKISPCSPWSRRIAFRLWRAKMLD